MLSVPAFGSFEAPIDARECGLSLVAESHERRDFHIDAGPVKTFPSHDFVGAECLNSCCLPSPVALWACGEIEETILHFGSEGVEECPVHVSEDRTTSHPPTTRPCRSC